MMMRNTQLMGYVVRLYASLTEERLGKHATENRPFDLFPSPTISSVCPAPRFFATSTVVSPIHLYFQSF